MSLIQQALEKAGKKAEPEKIVVPDVRDENMHMNIPPALPMMTEKKEKPFVPDFAALKSFFRMPKAILPVNVRRDLLTLIAIAGVLLIGFGFLALYREITTSEFRLQPRTFASGVPALVSNAAPEPLFVLTGITSTGAGRLALVNNQVVAVGDRLKGDATVKLIEEKTVVLSLHGREIKLSL